MIININSNKFTSVVTSKHAKCECCWYMFVYLIIIKPGCPCSMTIDFVTSCYRYWVFRSWGRIGTTIGGHKLEVMDTAMNAERHFKFLYEEKTGNTWEGRSNFQKVSGRFFPVDLDYGQVKLFICQIDFFLSIKLMYRIHAIVFELSYNSYLRYNINVRKFRPYLCLGIF